MAGLTDESKLAGVVHEFLHGLLELNLAKKPGVVLGVEERGLASSIKATLAIDCDASDRSLELLRGIRLHQEKLLAGLEQGDTKRSQLGLGHAYSRAKVKFNVNRSDNMIIQAIALLDQLDKDVNTFAMRVREWYGWHFPELVRIVPDNYQYAKVIHLLGDKSQLTEEILEPLTELLGDNDVLARNILDASRASMGTDISPVDHINIKNFATRVIHLYDYRKSLQKYLSDKMGVVAPNLASLIGDTVGARLISHAGSLTNLSKYPASTVQILGAEKALFRALKTKGNTPKYGLIYHSTFIGRAGTKNKGRISRFLANKCSIASRVSAEFSDFFEAVADRCISHNYRLIALPIHHQPSSVRSFETKLRSDYHSTKTVQTLRSEYYSHCSPCLPLSSTHHRTPLSRNADAMKKALDAYKLEVAEANVGEEGAEAKMDVDEDEEKKEKKDKKKKRKSLAADETVRFISPFSKISDRELTLLRSNDRLRRHPRRSRRRIRSQRPRMRHQWTRLRRND